MIKQSYHESILQVIFVHWKHLQCHGCTAGRCPRARHRLKQAPPAHQNHFKSCLSVNQDWISCPCSITPRPTSPGFLLDSSFFLFLRLHSLQVVSGIALSPTATKVLWAAHDFQWRCAPPASWWGNRSSPRGWHLPVCTLRSNLSRWQRAPSTKADAQCAVSAQIKTAPWSHRHCRIKIDSQRWQYYSITLKYCIIR